MRRRFSLVDASGTVVAYREAGIEEGRGGRRRRRLVGGWCHVAGLLIGAFGFYFGLRLWQVNTSWAGLLAAWLWMASTVGWWVFVRTGGYDRV